MGVGSALGLARRALAKTVTQAEINAVGGDPVARARQEAFPGMPQPSRRVKRVAAVGDSFIALTGGTSFMLYVARGLRARLGNAGAGYIPATSASFSQSMWNTIATTGPGTKSFRWDDPRRSLNPNGMGYYRTGTGGSDGNANIGYTPNAADNYGADASTMPNFFRMWVVLRSQYAGFQIRHTSAGQTDPTWAQNFSSGATFTGSLSGGTLTASAVTGVIARTTRIFGADVGATITTVPGGSNNGSAGTYAINVTGQSVASQAMTSDPAGLQPILNLPQTVGYMTDPTKTNSFQLLGVYGDLLYCGSESYNGNAGVTVSNFGQGGTTAAQYASLDDAAQRRFWQMADYDLVVLCLGMNDRDVYNPALFMHSMATIISRIKSGGRTQVLLVRQTDPADASSTQMGNYTGVLQTLATSMGCGYYDMRQAHPNLATYALANAAGYMQDGVHISDSASQVVGNDLLSKVSLL